MPRPSGSVPKYRKHRASGQAVVTLSGRDFYLGPHGSKVSRAEYDRVVGEWLAAGRQLPVASGEQSGLSVGDLLARYEPFARQHYRKDGELTDEYHNLRYAARLLRKIYGHTPANDFGPLALKALRQRMVADGLCRTQVNVRIGRIKRIFKWAVSEQLVASSVLHGLQSVTGLQFGRTEARETSPVAPAKDADVEAALRFMPEVVADVVRFQRLTGCRPGEACRVRPCDVDRSGSIWIYRPHRHKTQHHGRQRIICIGPRAQEILRPYLLRESTAYCFTPTDSEKRRKVALRAARKTKVQPSQRDRRKSKPQLQPGTFYARDSYARAVRRACDEAGVSRWAPNRLRHTAASEIRRQFGLEAAGVTLGHARCSVSEIYAERDQTLATRVAEKIG